MLDTHADATHNPMRSDRAPEFANGRAKHAPTHAPQTIEIQIETDQLKYNYYMNTIAIPQRHAQFVGFMGHSVLNPQCHSHLFVSKLGVHSPANFFPNANMRRGSHVVRFRGSSTFARGSSTFVNGSFLHCEFGCVLEWHVGHDKFDGIGKCVFASNALHFFLILQF